MADDKNFFTVFDEFKNAISVPDLHFNEDGICEIQIDDNLIVNMKYDETNGQILTYATVDDIDEIPNRAELLEQMMRANFFWTLTKGFTISLDPDSEKVVVHDRRSGDFFVDADFMAAYINACVEVVEQLREVISAQYLEPVQDIFEQNIEDNGAPEPEETGSGNGGNWMQI